LNLESELKIFAVAYNKYTRKRDPSVGPFYDILSGRNKNSRLCFSRMLVKLKKEHIEPIKYLLTLSTYGKFRDYKRLPYPGFLCSDKAIEIYKWKTKTERAKYQNETDMLKNLPEGVTTNRESILEQVREDHNYHWMHSRVSEETKREREHLFMLMLAKETSVSPWYLALSDKFYNSSCLEMVNDKGTEKLYRQIKNCRAYYRMHPLLKKKAMEIFLSPEELDA
jgi:hypothetical protein